MAKEHSGLAYIYNKSTEAHDSTKGSSLKTVTLPEDLMAHRGAQVLVYEYQARQESTNQLVNLSMNTFSFLTEGHKEVHSDTKSMAISNSQFLSMKAGKCLMTEQFADTHHRYRSILLFFSDHAVLQFVRKHSIVLSKTVIRKSVQAMAYDGYMRSFVKSLTEISRLSGHGKYAMLPIKLEEVLLYLVDRLGADFLASLITPAGEHVQHFQNVVENNKLNRLSLNELAFLCNMSLSTFKRTFENRFHMSPSKWFQERRLEYAALLLKSEGKRPTDIYLQAGYESLTNFVQAFKSKYGVTPKQYQSS